ncbi:hypothetical protein [Motiliproteus sp. MSK22-1]|uniref:hypothetical protein n=1 Tax=Motiliproteus sp. MSK22-1 TaxID=1897630 RepID=UPI000977D77D|nr:hypothetical protein [Motiliproteus sp. MSK22-1]OMH38880.1 hypothetical protein BGP75_00440 [Motiliproteus sp. MSK22-1]
MSDYVFPLVFPDFLIAVPRPSIKVDLPDFLPFDDVIEDLLDDKTTKVPDLGHAGVLFIGNQGGKGVTKYYEYGRYRSGSGETRRRPMPDCSFINGKPETRSLTDIFHHISKVSGQNGRISGVSIEVPEKYKIMLEYCKKRVSENRNPNRKKYDIINYSCVTFVQEVVESAGVKYDSSVLDARPISYINTLKSEFTDINYFSNTLEIEGH